MTTRASDGGYTRGVSAHAHRGARPRSSLALRGDQCRRRADLGVAADVLAVPVIGDPTHRTARGSIEYRRRLRTLADLRAEAKRLDRARRPGEAAPGASWSRTGPATAIAHEVSTGSARRSKSPRCRTAHRSHLASHWSDACGPAPRDRHGRNVIARGVARAASTQAIYRATTRGCRRLGELSASRPVPTRPISRCGEQGAIVGEGKTGGTLSTARPTTSRTSPRRGPRR